MADYPEQALTPPTSAARPRTPFVLEPSKGFRLDLRELWAYRELLAFLVWRDIKVRYKQTALGASWALIQPVISMIIFSLIFGHFAKIPSEGLPYPIFVFAGLLPWTYFASSLAASSASIVGSSNLVTKVFFPRLLIPLASVVVPMVDFFVASTVLIGLMGWYGIVPTWRLAAFPLFLLLAVLLALGVGLWLSALNVRYRDVPYAIPFLVQVWMYASPVIYPVSLLPDRWQWVLSLNPMAGVIDGFRWALLDHEPFNAAVTGTSAGVTLVLLCSGVAYFKRVERHFADII